MDLDFTEEQQMLREMVRGVCGSYASLDVVREMEDDPVGYPADLWDQLTELGLTGLMIPTSYGGSGMSMLDAAIVYEELGRALAPSPHFVSSVMAARVLEIAGDDDQRSRWLPEIAGGRTVFTTGWLEPGSGFSALGVQLQAAPDGDDFILSGTKFHVPFAKAADRIVVLARTGSEADAVDLFIVDPASPGVSLEQQKTISSDTQYRVDLREVRVSATDRIGSASTGWSTWNTAMYDGAILLAAYAMGGARYSHEITTQYAKDREQFDKPLGAFQALAHYLADGITEIDGGTTLVYEAAWARSEGKPVERLAPMAKLFACQVFRDVTATGQQIFGGIGFTVEYDIQLYFRRAKQLQISWWDTRHLEELVAASVLDAVPTA